MDTLIDQKGIEAGIALKRLDPDKPPELENYELDGTLFNSTSVKKKRLVEVLPKWKARENDVYVVGFPKSVPTVSGGDPPEEAYFLKITGTTWIQEIAYLALHVEDIDQTKRGHNWMHVRLLEGSNESRPKMKWFTHPLLTWTYFWHCVLKLLFRLILLSIRQGHLIMDLNELTPSPRILKCHLPESMLPPDIYTKKARIIYIMRNPKDLVVSYFHYHKWEPHLPEYDSWDVFFDDYVSGKVNYGKWYDHVLGYWKRRNDDNVLFLTYEDMKKDGKAAVEQISQFLGYHYSDDIIERMVQQTTFKSMKANPMVNPDSLSEKRDPNLSFMRKGVVGDWKNFFSDAQNKAIEDLCKEKFAGTGLTFDFE